MTGLTKRAKRIGVAMALLFGLTVLSGVPQSLVSDELAQWLPGATEVLADHSEGGGG